MNNAQVGEIKWIGRIDTGTMPSDARKAESIADSLGDKLDQSAQKGEKGFLKMGAAIGLVAGAVQSVMTKAISSVSSSVGSAIKRVDTLNNSSRVFANMGFNIQDTDKAMKALVDSITGLPTPLDAAVRNMQLIAASTGDIQKSQKIFSALNNAIIGFGGSTEMVENAMIQLSQAFSNGKIDAQSWNSMINSGLGPALNALAKQMGKTTGELKKGLSEGTISVEEFQNAIIEMNEKGGGGMESFQKIAKDATSGIQTGWANMQTAISRGVAKVIEAIGSENISKAITAIGKAFEFTLGLVAKSMTWMIENIPKVVNAIEAVVKKLYDLRHWFKNIAIVVSTMLLPTMVKLAAQAVVSAAKISAAFIAASAKTIASWAVTFARYLAGIATMAAQTLVAGARMAAGFMLALGPIGMIVAAVAGAAALIIANWETVKNWLSSFWDWMKNVFGSITGFVKDAIGGLGGIISAPFVSAWETISGIFQKIISGARAAVDTVKGIFEWFTKDMSEKTEKAIKKRAEDIGRNYMGDLNRPYVIGGSGNPVQNRASGGPVKAGQPYVVGDNPDGSWNRTTELFVPNQSGDIISSKDLRGMGGGTEYNIGTITITDIPTADYFLRKLNINDEIVSSGLTPVKTYGMGVA